MDILAGDQANRVLKQGSLNIALMLNPHSALVDWRRGGRGSHELPPALTESLDLAIAKLLHVDRRVW